MPKRWKYNMPRHKEVFVAVFCFEKVALASIVSPLTSQCCTHRYPIIASAKRAAKRLAKRALLTNVYVYRNRATHTYSGLT